jgi:hypothetical protein
LIISFTFSWSLRDYKTAYMLFINNYEAPFTNNQAEGGGRLWKG